MVWCSIINAADRMAASVASPFGSAGAVPSRTPSARGATPAARAMSSTKRRRVAVRSAGTAGLQLDPEVDDGEAAGRLDEVAREDLHRGRVVEGGQSLRVGMHELLLERARR